MLCVVQHHAHCCESISGHLVAVPANMHCVRLIMSPLSHLIKENPYESYRKVPVYYANCWTLYKITVHAMYCCSAQPAHVLANPWVFINRINTTNYIRSSWPSSTFMCRPTGSIFHNSWEHYVNILFRPDCYTLTFRWTAYVMLEAATANPEPCSWARLSKSHCIRQMKDMLVPLICNDRNGVRPHMTKLVNWVQTKFIAKGSYKGHKG